MKNWLIYPRPKKMAVPSTRSMSSEVLDFSGPLMIDFMDDKARTMLDGQSEDWLSRQLKLLEEARDSLINQEADPARILIEFDKARPDQGYLLQVRPQDIIIQTATGSGLFYGLVTLRQLLAECQCCVPCLTIEDQPDLPVRGVLVDIGRGKIPHLKCLFDLIDLLANLKINHMQLYMEGYSFAYARYADYFPDEAPITAEEIRLLDAHARERYIDLVPCQNTLGHMEAWLAIPEFNALAEAPDGLPLVPGLRPQATTLDPRDPGSLELVMNLLNELLPNFQSEWVNINMDEPIELGLGKNLDLPEDLTVSKIYLDFLCQIMSILHAHQKRGLIWSDFLFQHPELLYAIPKDMIVLDWNYESRTSFEAHAKALNEHSIPFYLCPGTSSWNSLAGRTDNMKANILDAATQAQKFGAKGLLVTDWGDYGHWQAPPVSYPAFAYAAAWSWNLEGNRDLDAADYLDRFVFKDSAGIMGRFWEDLGNYYHYENAIIHNMTLTFLVLSPLTSWDTHEDFTSKLNLYFQLLHTLAGTFNSLPSILEADYDFDGLMLYLEELEQRLEQNKMTSSGCHHVDREAQYTIQLIRHGARFYQLARQMSELEEPVLKGRLVALLDDLGDILDLYKELWAVRNRIGASENRNAMGLTILLAKYRKLIKQEIILEAEFVRDPYASNES